MLSVFFEQTAEPFSVFGFDVLLFVGVMTVLHLRHTHLWITVPGIWARLLQTPAHHQIHHSADPRHFDKNLGLFLSVWDWAFGTLWTPERRKEALTFGLGAAKGHHGVVDAWVSPCREAARIVAAGLGDATPVAARDAAETPASADDPAAVIAVSSRRAF